MSLRKVPQYQKPLSFVVVDTRATEGAVVGENLRWPDGRLVTPSDFGTSTTTVVEDDDPVAPTGSGFDWLTVTADVASATTDTGYIADATGGLIEITLPASVPQGFRLAVNAHGGQVRIVTNGNDIDGVGIGNDLLLGDGDTVSLVARATGILEPINAIQALPEISKTLAYDGSDRLSVVTDDRGTKTLGYDGSSRLITITGTGAYPSKTLTYNGGGQLTAVTVAP